MTHCCDEEEERCRLVPQQHSAAISGPDDDDINNSSSRSAQQRGIITAAHRRPTNKTPTTSLTIQIQRRTGPDSAQCRFGLRATGLLAGLLLSLALMAYIGAPLFEPGLREGKERQPTWRPSSVPVAVAYDERKDDNAVAVAMEDILGKGCVTGAEERCRPLKGGQLRRLVHECARRLNLPRGGCRGEGSPEASTAAAGARARGEGNTYRVPFMETGDLPCGFEVGFMLDAFYLKFQTVVHTADVFQLVFLGLFVHAAVRGELALSR